MLVVVVVVMVVVVVVEVLVVLVGSKRRWKSDLLGVEPHKVHEAEYGRGARPGHQLPRGRADGVAGPAGRGELPVQGELGTRHVQATV